MIEPVRVVPTTVMVEAATAVTLPFARAKLPKPPRPNPPDGAPLGKPPDGAPLGKAPDGGPPGPGAPEPFGPPPKPPLHVPLTGWVITTVAAVKLVTRGRGLADGAAELGAADPDDALRAAIAATHVPTTTEAFVVALVSVNAVFEPNVTVT